MQRTCPIQSVAFKEKFLWTRRIGWELRSLEIQKTTKTTPEHRRQTENANFAEGSDLNSRRPVSSIREPRARRRVGRVFMQSVSARRDQTPNEDPWLGQYSMIIRPRHCVQILYGNVTLIPVAVFWSIRISSRSINLRVLVLSLVGLLDSCLFFEPARRAAPPVRSRWCELPF